MALSAGAVVAQFDGDFSGLNKGLQEAQSKVENFTSNIKKAGNKIGEVFGNIGDAAMKYGKILGVAGTVAGVGALTVAKDVETMQVALKTAFKGSQTEADKAYASIKKFSDSTPYEMGEVLNAFIKLKNMGLDPGQEALTAYGNTASSMGKSLDQMIEAVADASTGEFERLKEFGIRSSKEGDRVKFTFQGVTKEVGFNSGEIQKYLMDIGNTNFAGGMEAQSKTLSGLLSTLKGDFFGFVNEVAVKSGLLDAAKNVVKKLSEALKGLSFESITNGMQSLEGLRALIFEGDFQGSDNLFGMGEDSEFVTFVLDARKAVVNFNDSLQPLIQSVKSFFERYIIAYIPTLQLFLGILLVLATQVLAGLKGAWEQLKKPVGDLLMAFIDFWETVQPLLQGFLIAITIILVPAFQFLLAVVVQVFSGIITAISGALNVVTGIIKTVFGIIAGIMTGNFSGAVEGFKQIFRGWGQWMQGAINIVLAPFRGLIDGIKNTVQGIDFFRIAVEWMNSLINGIKSKAGGIGGAVKSAIGGMLPEGVRKLIPGFADGVRNFSGGLAVVGERGPELVNLPKGADVFTNEESKRMTGGQGIIIETMNIKSGVDWELGASYMAQKLRLS